MHAFVRIVRSFHTRDRDVRPVIFTTSPGPGADARQVGRREPRDRMADVLHARFRHAQRHAAASAVGIGSGARSPGGSSSLDGLERPSICRANFSKTAASFCWSG
jgi:hypothetical protein